MKDLNSIHLYNRPKDYIPRVAAVHDLCGYGKCSLGVAIPVLSAGGCDVCPIPTSLFSAHTEFPYFYVHDTTSMIPEYLEAWKKEGVELDAIYSGFLGSAEQVASIEQLYSTYPTALRVVDPVMGDKGKIYPTYTPELCEAMKSLTKTADLLTPNLTEASILTDIPYEGQNLSDEKVQEYMDALNKLGAKYIILKGVSRDDGVIRNFVGGPDVHMQEVDAKLLPFMIHGTGDLFASSLLAAVMCHKNLIEATQFASNLVCAAMIETQKQPNWELRGISFETVLGKVAALVPHQ